MSFTWTPALPVGTTVGRNLGRGDGSHEVEASDMDPAWFAMVAQEDHGLRFGAFKLHVPPSINLVFFPAGQAHDVPDCKTSAVDDSPGKLNPGTLVVQSLDNNVTSCLHLGSPTAKPSDPNGKLRWRIFEDSQLPALALFHQVQNGPTRIKNRLRLFGGKSLENVRFLAPGHFINDGHNDVVPEALREAAAEGRLMGIQVKFRPFNKHLPRLRDSIAIMYGDDNKDENEQEKLAGDYRWTNHGAMHDQLKDGPLSQFETAVKQMLLASEVTVTLLRTFSKKISMRDVSIWMGQYARFAHCMDLCAAEGPYWFYKTQPEFPGSAVEYFNRCYQLRQQPPMPWWLISKAIIRYSAHGLEELEPLEWSPVVPSLPHNHKSNEILAPNYSVSELSRQLTIFREQHYDNLARTLLRNPLPGQDAAH